MKKLIALAATAMMLLSLFTACGKEPAANNDNDTEKTTTFTVGFDAEFPPYGYQDENGEYVARGNRNIKINGENFKPLLADAVSKLDDVTVINQLNITDYLVNNNKIEGAVGFSIADGTVYEIRRKESADCNRRSRRTLPSEQSWLFPSQNVVSAV